MTEKVKGSVLVVGGGISGMQSALDLANSGYYVIPFRKEPIHWWCHGPAGQNLSHQRLCHVNHFAQTGRGRPAFEH